METHFSEGPPSVTFWGAARQVTGSMHLVEVGRYKILLDCGLVVGSHADTRLHNHTFPFRPADLDAVILSHAHIDHCGNLPNLVRQGFAGPIYCTAATRDLLALVLHESARIHEEDSFVQSVLAAPAAPAAEPLSSREGVRHTVAQCVPVPYDQPVDVNPSIRLRLVDAGHILGSAMVSLTVLWGGRELSLTFTGDVGRSGMSFLRPPAPVPAGDLLISECTYAGRTHEPIGVMVEALQAVVGRTMERGGKVLIPAFTLGRTQLMVHYLQEGVRGGRFPQVPIFVDSPLAADISEVHRHYRDALSDAYAAVVNGASGADGAMARPAGKEISYVRSWDESKELSTRREPCVVIASGGMCQGGRILNHLKHNIDDPRCSLLAVGYQAPHTLGHQLLERRPTVRFHGRRWNKWIEVVEFPGFSGHADHRDLLTFLEPLAGQTRKVRLVHGEPEKANLLAQDLRRQKFADVTMPGRGETVSLA